MSNPKTNGSVPPPQVHNGWVRASDLDEFLGRNLPIPTRVISNEEYFPLPQTPEQRAVEHRLLETADQAALRLGMTRRRFLRTSCGMAAAFAALNSVFGPFFTVDAAELFEPAAAAEKKADYFIFDVQTHHVATEREAPTASKEFLQYLFDLRRGLATKLNPELAKREAAMSDLHLENYIKEVFLDSETEVAVLSGLPSETEVGDVLPPALMARTRAAVNELAKSRRLIIHGKISPDLGARNRELMQQQAESLQVEAWKGYTGQSMVKGEPGWWLDDEKRTYPVLEYTRKLGIRNICLHKGLPLFPGNDEYWSPRDVMKAATDFPDLSFLLYHSGFKGLQDAMPAAQDGFQKTAYIPWVSDLCEWRRKNPHMTNVYMELGSTFGMMAATSPMLCCHVLGMILQAFGEDHVLWGTDSVWWGSPQWQIEALRRLQMPEDLMKRFGYKPLTVEVKRKIFGLNGARLYGIDPKAKRNPIPGDYVDQLRKQYRESGLAAPSNTQYGWIRVA